MITIATHIDIAANPEHVWETLVDDPAYAGWNPYITRIDGLHGDARIAVHADIRPGAAPVVQEIDVVSAVFPDLKWAGGLRDRSKFAGDHRFCAVETASGTRFEHLEHFSGTEAEAIIAAHGDIITANFERFNLALKQCCEG